MGFPEDASLHGHLLDRLYGHAFWLTLAAFLAVVAILGWCLVRYRARPGRLPTYTHGSGRGALLLSLGLAFAVFVGIDLNLALEDHRVFDALVGTPPDPAKAFRIQVMPQQFVWNVRYPGEDGEFGTDDDLTTLNQIHVPAGRPVLVELRSMDVVHSFFLPHFRIKQDALPGLTTRAYFQATKTGTYEVACAELCGLEHYRMRGFLHVGSEEEVAEWIARTREEYGADQELWRAWTRMKRESD
ncbi:MAG: cytochrome C oxidase subunit II [Planctomycetes bacterium]|nr:cytochrome C oxidase subunit II [Planctomycetota bacterium]